MVKCGHLPLWTQLGNTADPAKGCVPVCGLLYENMYMFFYRWYPGAGFSCSKGSITASSNLTVYKVKPVNKLQYLTRDVLAITPHDPRISTLDMTQTLVDVVLGLQSQH